MKLADDRHDRLLAAEHACMQLASALGLTTVTTNLAKFDGIEALVVQRYDRVIDPASDAIRRLHQEDACQALGINIDASQGRRKYERFGGPSFAQIAQLLDQYGNATIDHPALLRAAVFTSVIGNGDAHGKNVSLMIDTDTGFVSLAPLYDTVPTALWPKLRAASTMSVNGNFGRPSFNDFTGEARLWGLGSTAAEAVVDQMLTEVRIAVASCDHVAVAELVSSRLDVIEARRAS